MGEDRLIREHEAIWTEFHKPSGITLAESKSDWLDLLRDDPTMSDDEFWGRDTAGSTTESERRAFEAWLTEEADR